MKNTEPSYLQIKGLIGGWFRNTKLRLDMAPSAVAEGDERNFRKMVALCAILKPRTPEEETAWKLISESTRWTQELSVKLEVLL